MKEVEVFYVDDFKMIFLLLYDITGLPTFLICAYKICKGFLSENMIEVGASA